LSIAVVHGLDPEGSSTSTAFMKLLGALIAAPEGINNYQNTGAGSG
jgi:hypothetical protein